MSTKGQLEVLNLELKQENEALKDTVTILLKEMDKIREIDRPKIIRLDLTPEQRILETQIMYMEAISTERPLSLDETRTLDLHIKNKRLLSNKNAVDVDYNKVPEGVTESDLIRIAGSVEFSEEKPVKGSKS